ncbi:VOC family protein [Streptomyces sp. SID3343]|uniref:VOC family protein n=1 Tax=Streptomyces sp. SID3343 TaxID=2690260 RepID=UPI00136C1372|nr:VOC family protein [Streptomyces sp. SID3343]MYV98271.1 VOC family protein [Streptomyces sp. SID3343]
MVDHPQLVQTVLDTTEPRKLAEFYRLLLGMSYRPGDAPPEDGAPDEPDWLVLRDVGGANKLAFQRVERLPRTTWPRHDVPMQMHLDLSVPSTADLYAQRDRASALGAQLLLDEHDDVDEPLYVFADPSGHPFCIFVAGR